MVMADSIRVGVVEQHPLILEGTRSYLEQADNIEVSALAADASNILGILAEDRPHVLILDADLPATAAVELAVQVKASFPDLSLLARSAHDDPVLIRRLVSAGVEGYVSKTAGADELAVAVRAVAHGSHVVLSPAGNSEADGCEHLTERQRQVLEQLMVGARNADIAKALCVADKTVESHVSEILRKLGVRSRTQAVLKAREDSLLLLAAP